MELSAAQAAVKAKQVNIAIRALQDVLGRQADVEVPPHALADTIIMEVVCANALYPDHAQVLRSSSSTS